MKSPQLAAAAAFAQKNQQAARILGVTGLVVAMSAWTSCSALKVTKEAQTKISEATAVRERATRFANEFVPATTGETDEWSRTTQEAGEYGTSEALKVSLAQNVSRIAEVAGMSSVKVSFAPGDSVGVAGSRNIGDLTFQPATFGLTLEGTGSVSTVARVILRLPPATDIKTLSLAGGSDELKTTFHLAVYYSAGAPQN